MTISRTEFQRQPGKYFLLVQQGGEVIIKQMKPSEGIAFRLSVLDDDPTSDDDQNPYCTLANDLEKHPVDFSHTKIDGVEYQSSVRQ